MPHAQVMVIEDDADVRGAIAEALQDAGADVVVAEDGQAGIERLRAGTVPQVILLDLRMPRLDGEGFLREMRADPRFEHVPVITMTAGLDVPDRDAVVAHLHKPFDLDDLLQIVLSLCPGAG